MNKFREQIKAEYLEFLSKGNLISWRFSKNRDELKIFFRDREFNLFAKIEVSQSSISPDIFFVDYSNCTKKGFGKLLYYICMNLIYPKYLSPDSSISSDALKIWNRIHENCEFDKSFSTSVFCNSPFKAIYIKKFFTYRFTLESLESLQP